jgi:type VI secretion system protein ImpC
MSAQINEIMHAPSFQQLEAAWRGLHFLVMNSETGTSMKLRVMYATKKELLDDLEKATEFDQSALFKKIYEEEYGTFGGHPYSVLVGDYEFGRHPQDIGLLEKISNVAAAAHAPFISAAAPAMFDMESFTELTAPRDLAKLFESSELIKWRSFRDSEDSRYVCLTMPHILLRLPYGPKTVPVEGFNFQEDTDGRDHKKYLWGNAAYALGQRITNAFALYKWTAAIRGVEGGGVVAGLPAHTFKTDEGDIALKCPTEIAITDRREKELDDLGFLALCHCKGTDYAAFFGSATANKPKKYDTNSANANARLSSMLPYILSASRFAHYLKVIMRDKIGSFQSRADIDNFLNRWISQYVQLNDTASQEVKARQPLRDARIDVSEVPGKPGSYRAVAFLRPHFQLNELTASIRLVAELPPPAA